MIASQIDYRTETSGGRRRQKGRVPVCERPRNEKRKLNSCRRLGQSPFIVLHSVCVALQFSCYATSLSGDCPLRDPSKHGYVDKPIIISLYLSLLEPESIIDMRDVLEQARMQYCCIKHARINMQRRVRRDVLSMHHEKILSNVQFLHVSCEF